MRLGAQVGYPGKGAADPEGLGRESGEFCAGGGTEPKATFALRTGRVFFFFFLTPPVGNINNKKVLLQCV